MNCVFFVKMDKVFSLKKTFKNTGKMGKKYWKSQGILSVRKVGTMLTRIKALPYEFTSIPFIMLPVPPFLPLPYLNQRNYNSLI